MIVQPLSSFPLVFLLSLVFAVNQCSAINHNPPSDPSWAWGTPGNQYQCDLSIQNMPSKVTDTKDGFTLTWTFKMENEGVEGTGLTKGYKIVVRPKTDETGAEGTGQKTATREYTADIESTLDMTETIRADELDPCCAVYVDLYTQWKEGYNNTPTETKEVELVSESQGPAVNSVHYAYGLGRSELGDGSGILLIESEVPTDALYSPSGILVSACAGIMQYRENGAIRQTLSDTQLTDIQVVDGDKYEIRSYPRSQVSNPGGAGPWNISDANSYFKRVVVENPGAADIGGTDDDKLYYTERTGARFGYSLPHGRGDYRLTLRFAENYHTAAGQRLFDVKAENVKILNDLDIYAQAGGRNQALTLTLPLSIADSKVDLEFVAKVFQAEVSAIELSKPGLTEIDLTDDDELYHNGRWGAFAYAIPVPNGSYQVTLHFVERYFASGGVRIFDVKELDKANAESPLVTTLLDDFDIFQAAGAIDRAVTRTVNVEIADGSIDLDFAGPNTPAVLSAIRISRDEAGIQTVVAAINCGGNQYSSADGTIYAADSLFTGGELDAEHGSVQAINAGGREFISGAGVNYSKDTNYRNGTEVFSGTSGVRFTEMAGNQIIEKADFSWVVDPVSGRYGECVLNTGWSDSGGNNAFLRKEGKFEQWSADRTTRVETHTIRNGEDELVSKEETHYRIFDFGERKVKHVIDPDGAALTTIWEYSTPQLVPGDPIPVGYGLVREMRGPNGYWEQYAYNGNGQRIKVVSQFQNSALGDEAQSRVVTFVYSEANPLVTRVEQIGGVEIGRSYVVEFDEGDEREVWNIVCQRPGAPWDASDNLVSATRTFKSTHSNALSRGKTKWSSDPDGTTTIYSYAVNGRGEAVTSDRGEPNGNRTGVIDGTRTITIRNESGQTVSETISDIASGLQLQSWAAVQVDSLGRPTLITYSDGTSEQKVYRDSSLGCSSCSGSDKLLLESLIDRDGLASTYTYDALDRLIGVTRQGITTVSVFDAAGRVTRRTRVGTDGSQINLERINYDLAGRVTQTLDPLDEVTTLEYTALPGGGLVTTVTYPDGGTKITTTYGDGQIAQIAGTASAPEKFAYGSWNGGTWTKEIRVGEGGSETEWIKTYLDANGQIVKVEYPDGAQAMAVYNDKGQKVRERDPDGVTHLFAYNSKGEMTVRATDVNGNGLIDYAGSDRIIRVTKIVATAHGTTVRRTKTEVWPEAGADSPMALTTVDESADGLRQWNSQVDQTATMVRSIPGNGAWTVTTTQPSGAVTMESYTNGRLSGTQAVHGGSVTQAYDSHGRLSSHTDPRTGTSSYTYNSRDEVVSVSAPNPTGNGLPLVTNYQVDALGRRTGVQLPDGSWTHTVYDHQGNTIRIFGSQNYDVSYSFDPQNRIKTMTTTGQAGAAVTTWCYKPQRGWLSGKLYSDGKGTSYTYTPSGRLLTRLWQRGVSTSYEYDAAGDLCSVDYSDSTPDVFTSYNRVGRPVHITDGTGARSLTYRPADLQLEREILDGAIDRAILRSYDSLRRYNGFDIGADSNPDGDYSIRYGFDTAGRLNEINEDGDTWIYARVANSALISTLTRGPSVVAYEYEQGRNVLSSIESKRGSTVISKYEYAVNSIGQRTSLKQSGTAHGVATFNVYHYNPVGEVISAKRYIGADLINTSVPVTEEDYEWQFDGIGNRTRYRVAQSGETDYASNKLNQYTSIADGSTVDIATVDDDGNISSQGGKVFTWDGENRLLAVTPVTPIVGDKRVENGYDYLSRRVEKKVQKWTGGEWLTERVERYLYDGWNLVCIYDGFSTNALVKRQVWGLDRSGSLSGNGGVGGLLALTELAGSHEGRYFVFYEGNGNVAQVIDSGGTIKAQYEYEPFGGTSASSGDYADANAFRFSTKFYDSEVRLLYYGYRFYDAITGRWLSRDPIGHQGGQNLYSFNYNSPLSYIDPLGLSPNPIGRGCCNEAKLDTVGHQAASAAVAATGRDPLNREFCGLICCKGGDVIFTTPHEGWFDRTWDNGFERRENRCDPRRVGGKGRPLGCKKGYIEVATYHSHPGNTAVSDGDRKYADATGNPDYKGTPNGEVERVDPDPEKKGNNNIKPIPAP